MEASTDELDTLLPAVVREHRPESAPPASEARSAGPDLSAIYRLCQPLHELRAPESLASELLRILGSALGFENAAVLLVDEAAGCLRPFAVSPAAESADDSEGDASYNASHDLRLGVGVAGWVARTGRAVRLGQVRPDQRFYGQRQRIRSEMCVPMRAGQQILGVVTVESERLEAYGEAEQAALTAVADQAAIAIQNVNLLSTVRQQAFEQQQNAAQRTTELEGVVRQLSQALALQQATEAALRDSEARYRQLFDSMIQGVVYLDGEARITSANPAAERILGRARDELVGQTPYDLGWHGVHEDGSAMPVEDHPAILCLRSGKQVGHVVMGKRVGDGTRMRWMMISAVPQFADGEVKPSQVLLTIYDITDRQRVEAMVKQSEARFRTLVDRLPAILYVGEKQPIGRMVYVSPHIERLLGYSTAEWLSTPEFWGRVLHPDDRERVLSELERGFRGETRTLSVEYRLIDRQGRVHWFQDEAEVVDGGNDVRYLQGVMIDFTDRKEIEAAIQQRNEQLARLNQTLTAQNEELNAYSHTVAHDLKNPVATLLGYGQLLEQDLERADLAAAAVSVGAILENGQRLQNIIQELLLLSEIRELDEIAVEPLDMRALLERVTLRLARILEGRRAVLTIGVLSPAGLGYAPWIEEVWVNYLTNAVKYGGEPPRLEIGSNREPDGMVRFWVRDNGAGLTAVEQQRLFARFTRLTYQVRAQGHGLGLSIVQRIVGKLGGAVGVESRPGQGSLFWFSLPSAEQRGEDRTTLLELRE
jgi:PAS domain S-box-containing protein